MTISLSHWIRMSINYNYYISRFVCLCFTSAYLFHWLISWCQNNEPGSPALQEGICHSATWEAQSNFTCGLSSLWTRELTERSPPSISGSPVLHCPSHMDLVKSLGFSWRISQYFNLMVALSFKLSYSQT